MPRKSVPSYRLHKASGQARAIVNGKHIYLGKFNSPESRKNYALLLANLEFAKSVDEIPRSGTITVAEVLAHYLDHAEGYYASQGRPGKEYHAMVAVADPVNMLYGDTLADEFGPLKLKKVRQHLVDGGLCRTEVNKRIARVKRMFKWAVSEELIGPSVYHSLQTVAGLKLGRTTAPESKPVKPIDEKFVELTLPFVAPQVAAMARLQLLTGMRPGEVTSMRLRDINREEGVWVYTPSNHKNRWRGHKRPIPLGPRSQEILQPFLERDNAAYFFSPAEAEQWRNTQHTSPQPPNARLPMRTLGERKADEAGTK